MTSNDFNRAFQDFSASQLPPAGGGARGGDPRWIVDRMLRRDLWRTRILAGLSLFFWLIGVAGMLLLLAGLNRLVIFIRVADNLPWSRTGNPVPEPNTKPLPLWGDSSHPAMSHSLDQMFWGTDLIHHGIPFVAASLIAVMLAALFTVLLIFSSRTATLNRINISLGRLSEQLESAALAGVAAVEAPPAAMQQQMHFEPRPRTWLNSIFLTILCFLGVALLWNGGFHNLIGYSRLAPYDAVRWHGETPQVRVAGTWYELDAVDEVPVEQIVGFAKSRDVATWQKHFEEDLVELMTQMDHAPGQRVTLLVKELTTGQTQSLDVPMTEENRDAVWQAREQSP